MESFFFDMGLQANEFDLSGMFQETRSTMWIFRTREIITNFDSFRHPMIIPDQQFPET
jgi:hypothetical protein